MIVATGLMALAAQPAGPAVVLDTPAQHQMAAAPLDRSSSYTPGITALDFGWLADRYRQDPQSQRRWTSLVRATDAIARARTESARRGVDRLSGYSMVYQGDGCFGDPRCQLVVRTIRVSSSFATYEEFQQAWNVARPHVEVILSEWTEQPQSDDLRQELLSRLARDQSLRSHLSGAPSLNNNERLLYRLALGLLISRIGRSDTAWLSNVVDRFGWPSRQLVGDDGMEAAWILLVHSRDDPVFRLTALERMRSGLRRGLLSSAYYATKEDHIFSETFGWQRYGTKGDCIEGRFQLTPVRAPSGLSERRARMSLPSLEEQSRLLDAACQTTN